MGHGGRATCNSLQDNRRPAARVSLPDTFDLPGVGVAARFIAPGGGEAPRARSWGRTRAIHVASTPEWKRLGRHLPHVSGRDYKGGPHNPPDCVHTDGDEDGPHNPPDCGHKGPRPYGW